MMACGGACVVAKVTGVEEAIVPGENAVVVEPGDIEGARKAVRRLMEDSALRAKLMENGMRAVEQLDWERSIDVLEKIFLSPVRGETKVSKPLAEKRQHEREGAFIQAYTHIVRMERLFRESERGKQRDVDSLRGEIERRDKDIAILRERDSFLEHELNQRDTEIGFLRDEVAARDKGINALQNDVGGLRHCIDLKNHELNSIYHSKQWKIASAIKEARHSVVALLKLPYRIIRIIFGW
jgi:archaellum component FlaC